MNTKSKEQVVQDKLKVYQEALTEAIKQLTQKRTELATLARQTVEQLEASIPVLKNQVTLLNKEIERLNNVILEKSARAMAEEVSCKAEYKKRERDLEASYLIKKDALNDIETKQIQREKEFQLNLADLVRRENALKSCQEVLAVRTDDLNKSIDCFDATRTKDLREIRSLREEVENRLLKIIESEELLKSKQDEYLQRMAELEVRESQAKEIISKINEAQKILDIASAKEVEVKNLREKLNQGNVKLMADIRRLNMRSTELDNRQSQLNDRENNIKMIESELAK